MALVDKTKILYRGIPAHKYGKIDKNRNSQFSYPYGNNRFKQQSSVSETIGSVVEEKGYTGDTPTWPPKSFQKWDKQKYASCCNVIGSI